MKRELIQTADGSWTIQLPDWNEQYHSKHGAIAEARHVFIQNGLSHLHQTIKPGPVSILEIGFGTGLNALLSLQFAQEHSLKIDYTGMEAFPVAETEWKAVNYANAVGMSDNEFEALHTSPWEQAVLVSSNFSLTKKQQKFDLLSAVEAFDLVYYDAFGPRVQPELWQDDILQKTYDALKPGGIWVSYCAKGDVRRSLQTLGFEVERLQGPPGKRHMLRGCKVS